MSLINDALKRAEADKSGYAQFRRFSQPLKANNSDIPRTRTWPAMTIASLVLAGVTAWAGWTFFYAPVAESHPLSPRRATAASEAEKPDLQLQRASDEPAKPRSAQDRPSQQKTAAFAGKLLKRFAGAVAGGPIPAKSRPAIAAIPAVQPGGSAVAEPVKPTGHANALAKFRLTGVIRGPAGVSSVINNKIVEPGQTIDGAKLISVDRTSVVLEIDGRLHRLRL